MAKKKALLGVVCLAMVALIAVFGTVAYLTDRDAETNVFTSGDVSIDLTEDFVQNSALLPGVEIKKEVTITNDGKNDAWVWYTYAIPENIASLVDISGNDNWDTEKIAPVTETIDGVSYKVYTCVLNDALTVDAAVKGMTSVKLDPTVDYYNGKYYTVVGGVATEVAETDLSDVNIIVTAYAIQKDESINSVKAGYVAFCDQWGKVNNWPKTWDGTADTSWYNDTDTEFVLTTSEQLAGLAELVDGGNNFAGKTIKLDGDVDLYAEDENGNKVSFNPIGDKSAFAGTFDGQGHSIENLYQSGWAFGYEWGKYGSIGLFGELEGATVKNVTISGAEAQIEGGDIGGICGSATGTCVFENITIEDSKLGTYNNGLGGIIGWSGAGNYTFKNITIGEDVVLAGLWGSFDSSIGGVVGQGEPGATYNFENVDIACRLDVYNDCTASYDYYNYRMCGMIIGRLAQTTTIDGVNYPDTSKYNINCTNVTVTYGKWSDYHYCEPTPGLNGGRGMRVEPGYAYDGLPADFDHTQCTTNHMTLMPFDQIFGGDQYGVKGLKTYDGVTVIYNK